MSSGLLEREPELARISELLESTSEGSGRLLLVTGPAGIGKTSVLDSCARSAAERGLVALRARGDELVMESSFAGVRELLWREVRAAGKGIWDGAAQLAAPVFEDGRRGRTDRDVVDSVLHGLYWLVSDLAERAPLALLVDDAQWLDAASARFLAYLARRVDSLPVLLAIVMRHGPGTGAVSPLGALAELPANNELRICALSEEGSAALVRARLGARADEELCRSCHEATGGNPFYLLELAAALRSESSRPTAALADRVRELGAGAVGRSVLIRLARLGAECERLAQVVAVLGPGCPLRHAAALAGFERQRAEAAADALRAEGLFAAGRLLAFVHPIVSEALLAELPPSRLAALHGQAAGLLAADGARADQVAAHLVSAEPYGEEWVVDALRAAAHDALARGDPDTAVLYLRRALDEPPPAGLRLEVLTELGRAERTLPAAQAFPALREAYGLTRDPQRRAEIALELALAQFGVMQSSAGRLVLEEALEHERSLRPETVEPLEAALIGGGLDDLSATPVLMARAEAHFKRARRGDVRDPRMLAALAILGVLTGMAAAECAALARRALANDRLLTDWLDFGYVTAGYVMCSSERFEEAAAALDAGIAEAQRRGLAPMFMQLATVRAETALRIGDLDGAQLYAERELELGREFGAERVALQWLPIVLIERGDVRAARGLVESIDLRGPILGGSFAVMLLAHRGRVRIAAGALDAGVVDLLDAERRMAAVGWKLSVQTDWVPSAAPALVALGRKAQAVELVARELAEAVAFGAPRRHGVALSLSGLLEPSPNGLARLNEAVRILEHTPARLEQARALVNLGEGLRIRGQRAEARIALTRGLEMAHRCGGEALMGRARAELVASGARPRRSALSGPDALTPAELRAARMAAGGLSNREIAQSLFVSSKTVESHLSQVYSKLSISNRHELAGALERWPPRSVRNVGG